METVMLEKTIIKPLGMFLAHYSQWLYRFIIVMSIIERSYNEKEVRHNHSDDIT